MGLRLLSFQMLKSPQKKINPLDSLQPSSKANDPGFRRDSPLLPGSTPIAKRWGLETIADEGDSVRGQPLSQNSSPCLFADYYPDTAKPGAAFVQE